MSCILHIETSTEACSVAVSEDGWNEFKVADLQGPQHAVQLGVFVDEALSFVDSHGMVWSMMVNCPAFALFMLPCMMFAGFMLYLEMKGKD